MLRFIKQLEGFYKNVKQIILFHYAVDELWSRMTNNPYWERTLCACLGMDRAARWPILVYCEPADNRADDAGKPQPSAPE